jgi:hypothetical protein
MLFYRYFSNMLKIIYLPKGAALRAVGYHTRTFLLQPWVIFLVLGAYEPWWIAKKSYFTQENPTQDCFQSVFLNNGIFISSKNTVCSIQRVRTQCYVRVSCFKPIVDFFIHSFICLTIYTTLRSSIEIVIKVTVGTFTVVPYFKVLQHKRLQEKVFTPSAVLQFPVWCLQTLSFLFVNWKNTKNTIQKICVLKFTWKCTQWHKLCNISTVFCIYESSFTYWDLFDRTLLKESSRRGFSKIRPSPIDWEPFN